MTLGFAGLMTSDDTDSAAMKSSTGVQPAPPFVVFQMPPPTLPANIVSGVFGWMTIERMRPPTFPGPSHRHDFGEMSDAPAADAGARAENISGDNGGAPACSMRRAAPPHFMRST